MAPFSGGGTPKLERGLRDESYLRPAAPFEAEFDVRRMLLLLGALSPGRLASVVSSHSHFAARALRGIRPSTLGFALPTSNIASDTL